MRCRLRKKLRLLNDESCNIAAALRERSNAAATIDLRNYNKNSAGSGNFVPFTGSSNPRVLSDMGLAIPRPTRLGDPRIFVSVFETIISLLLLPCPKGHDAFCSTSNLLE